mmetsp:Transcript_47369/g.101108  ORF Transcript_47369/g.101108 Transcript_47369/m.101108 type:complete len:252 (+) Transcript_47369:268-1023(+)
MGIGSPAPRMSAATAGLVASSEDSSMPCPSPWSCARTSPRAERTSTRPDESASSVSASPGCTKPSSTASAMASSQSRCTARRSGLAPNLGEKPSATSNSRNLDVSSSFTSISSQRRCSCATMSLATSITSSRASAEKTMISSSLFKNSGRKRSPNSRLTARRMFVYALLSAVAAGAVSASFRMVRDPMLEVRMSIALVKSTVRPLLSVSLPSSRTCRRMLKTSGCAFSTSSIRMSVCGVRRTASVSCPPAS